MPDISYSYTRTPSVTRDLNMEFSRESLEPGEIRAPVPDERAPLRELFVFPDMGSVIDSEDENENENENENAGGWEDEEEEDKENRPPAASRRRNTRLVAERYVGLKQMSYVYSVTAREYGKWNMIDNSLRMYGTARWIDPENEHIGDAAVMFENNGHIAEAIEWYDAAVANGDEIAMYNLADLYETGKAGDEHIDKSVSYYQMAADKDDNASLLKVLMYYYHKINKEGLTAHLLLHIAKNYLKMLELEDPYRDNPFYRDGPPLYETGVEMEDFQEFLKTYPHLVIIRHLETLVAEQAKALTTRQTDEANRYIGVMKNHDAYRAYRNKIQLFTRLNNVVDCSICYEEKLNISIHCGHSFCVDCYPKLYAQDCPMCRMAACNIELHQ